MTQQAMPKQFGHTPNVNLAQCPGQLAPKPGEINEQLEALNHNILELGGIIERLGERLNGVLNQQPEPNDSKDICGPKPMVTPIGQRLQDSTSAIKIHQATLSSYLRRVEL